MSLGSRFLEMQIMLDMKYCCEFFLQIPGLIFIYLLFAVTLRVCVLCFCRCSGGKKVWLPIKKFSLGGGRLRDQDKRCTLNKRKRNGSSQFKKKEIHEV